MGIVVTRAEEAMVRPLHWWSAAALGDAERRIQSLLEEWCNEWRLHADRVHAFNAGDGVSDEPSIKWMPLAVANARLGVAVADHVDAMHGLLFGTDPPALMAVPTLALEIAAQAWDDLCNDLSKSFEKCVANPVAPEDAEPRRWSGALRVDARLSGAGKAMLLHLQLGGALALQWCPTPVVGSTPIKRERVPLVPIVQAVSHRPVRLAVHLAEVEIDLGGLQSLRVGDVLALPHRLDDALTLHANGGTTGATVGPMFCKAHLGVRNGRLAVELVSDAINPGPMRH